VDGGLPGGRGEGVGMPAANSGGNGGGVGVSEGTSGGSGGSQGVLLELPARACGSFGSSSAFHRISHRASLDGMALLDYRASHVPYSCFGGIFGYLRRINLSCLLPLP